MTTTATQPKERSKIVNNKSFTVVIYETCAFVYWQSVNKKTGKGWQQHRDTTRFEGDRFMQRAMRAWLYAR